MLNSFNVMQLRRPSRDLALVSRWLLLSAEGYCLDHREYVLA
jgi:hypothetical protein